MSPTLKKKIIAAVVICLILGVLFYQSQKREREMQEFIKMQEAPLKEAEGQTK